MKSMLARKHKELPRQQRQTTHIAPLPGFNNRIPLFEGLDIRLDMRSRRLTIIHLLLQAINLVAVVFEGGADFLFEIVDDDEVGEEGDEVFDAEEVDAAEELDGGFYARWIAR